MYRRGAITLGGKSRALELELGAEKVEVLARLEPGFEEYVTFSRSDYDLIPEALPQKV